MKTKILFWAFLRYGALCSMAYRNIFSKIISAKSLYSLLILIILFSSVSAGNINKDKISNKYQPVGGTAVIAKLYMNMYVVKDDGSLSLADGVASTYYSSYHNAVDGQDAVKLNSFNTGESLCILRDGVQLSVEKRQPIYGHDTTYLQLMQMEAKQYQIQFVPQNFDNSLVAFLKDEYTGTIITINLSKTDTVKYTFKITPPIVTANAMNRFSIQFAPINELPVSFTSVNAIEYNKAINIQWKVENEINISQYIIEKSSDGNNFYTVETKQPDVSNASFTKQYDWTDFSSITGISFYRIKYQNKDGGFAYSKIVKIGSGITKSSISAYPTTINNGNFDLHFVNMIKGIYKVRLINNIGQVVFSKSIEHNGGSSVQNISVKNNSTKGIYYANIIGVDKYNTLIKLLN